MGNNNVVRPLLVMTVLFIFGCGGGGSSGSDPNAGGDSPPVDTTAPVVQSTSPDTNATGVAVNGVITATFSEDLAPATVNETTFIVDGVTGTVTLNGDIATFTPDAVLAANTRFDATITSAVTDLAGNALESDFTWSFTTGAAPDTTAPTIVGTNPLDGATNLAVTTKVTVTFSEDMDPATLTLGNFFIDGIDANVSLNGAIATLTPTLPLAPGVTYTARVTTGVTDLAGNPLAAEESLSFSVVAQSWEGTVQIGDVLLDEAWDVTTDSSGSIYVIGNTDDDLADPPLGKIDLGIDDDAFLAVYDASGAEQRFIQFGSSDDGDESAFGVAVDGSGNIYIVGDTSGNLAGPGSFLGGDDDFADVYLTKFNAAGVQEWITQFGTDLTDGGFGVAVDQSGNIYVVGVTEGDIEGTGANDFLVEDAFLAKFNSSGEQQWARQFGTNGYDDAFAVKVDSAGNIYVTGETNGSLATGNAAAHADAYLAVFEPTGTQPPIFSQFGTVANESGTGLAVDGQGRVFVGGDTDGVFATGLADPQGDVDAFLYRFDSPLTAGSIPEVTQFGSDAFDDVFGGVAIDAQGAVYVAGETDGDLAGAGTQVGEGDAYVARFAPDDLTEVWTTNLGSTDLDFSTGLSVGPDGGIFITGITLDGIDGNVNFAPGSADGFVAKFDANGELLPLP